VEGGEAGHPEVLELLFQNLANVQFAAGGWSEA